MFIKEGEDYGSFLHNISYKARYPGRTASGLGLRSSPGVMEWKEHIRLAYQKDIFVFIHSETSYSKIFNHLCAATPVQRWHAKPSTPSSRLQPSLSRLTFETLNCFWPWYCWAKVYFLLPLIRKSNLAVLVGRLCMSQEMEVHQLQETHIV